MGCGAVYILCEPTFRRLYIPPKRQGTQDVHSATSQTTEFLIVTAVETSKLAYYIFVLHILRHFAMQLFQHFGTV
jgi:hypothetical protein